MAITNKNILAHLRLEKADGELWGRVKVKGNLIVEQASSLDALKKKIKQLVFDFENVEIEDFKLSYDLTAFFESHNYLNISDIAKKAGISPTLMRQYASGIKFPSEDRVMKIEQAIHGIGRELTRVRLHKSRREYP
ncbi:MAG: helix-turn-helix domain-containing protein [Flavisolibacter sp.]